MMSEDNNMVALATPTRFLIESGEWNLTPNIGGSIHQEVNPFDCNFQQPIRTATNVKTNDKWSPPSPTSSTAYHNDTAMYSASPEPELNAVTSPSTPPSLSQSPSITSTSISLSSEHAASPTMVQQAPTNMINHQSPQQQQQQYIQQPENTINTTRRSKSRTQSKQQQSSFSEYLEDEEIDYKPKSASVHSGRKRRIVFEGDDAEDRRKKFLERNRVAAYKCRQKKKNWMQELEEKAEIQTNQNDEFRSLVARLKEESMYLRNLLLTHGNCDCDSVQAYLRKTSAQITSNSSPTLMSMSSRRSSLSTAFNAPPPMPSYHGSLSSMPSFPESSNTGLTPFLNTVINKPTQSSNSDPNDYFSQSHFNTDVA